MSPNCTVGKPSSCSCTYFEPPEEMGRPRTEMLALPPGPAVASVRMPGISSSTSASVWAPKSRTWSWSMSVTDTELRSFDLSVLVAVTTMRSRFTTSVLSAGAAGVVCACAPGDISAANAVDASRAATGVSLGPPWRRVR